MNREVLETIKYTIELGKETPESKGLNPATLHEQLETLYNAYIQLKEEHRKCREQQDKELIKKLAYGIKNGYTYRAMLYNLLGYEDYIGFEEAGLLYLTNLVEDKENE